MSEKDISLLNEEITKEAPTVDSKSEAPIIIVGREEDQVDTLGQHVYYAGFWMRFWAYLLDLIVIFSIHGIITKPLLRIVGVDIPGNGWITPYMVVSAVVFYGYFVLMTKWKGQTLGKMVFGLRVISIKEPSENLSWSTVIFREWIGRFISATLLFLYLFVAVLPRKQGIHDLFVDTTVIHENVVPVTIEKPHNA
ncbi:RDD family protein [Mangrovibacillus cuniculi]|uniref:RDD family protein n=1 Tax=Mangrovibacillus cuniculi TaxID=2593652 RepID=A0A7S8CC54_9BACI|nr:RDD family protein [Mangrovibacillus cuniculi]QPC47232.1 RDD family protein [Mangrovibacillus cuniculi]